MGGTNDPSNIELLTVSDHANRHYELWYIHGSEYDYLAWKGLSGQISKIDLIKKIQSIANTGKFMSEETRELIRQANLGTKHPERGIKISLAKKGKTIITEETKKKIGKAQIGRKHSQESKDKRAEKLQKEYHFLSPEGKHTRIINLQKFCRDNNLDQGNMTAIYTERLGRYKGWRKFTFANYCETLND